MLKKILELKGVKKITKTQQKEIKGGNKPPEMCYCVNLGNTVECDKYDWLCPLDY